MSFKIEEHDSYTLIEATTDRLDMQSASRLKSELVLLSGKAVRNMIIDLTQCSYCDSAGISAILVANRLCRNGLLILAGLQPNVERIVTVSSFNPPIDIAANAAEAKELMEQKLSQQN